MAIGVPASLVGRQSPVRLHLLLPLAFQWLDSVPFSGTFSVLRSEAHLTVRIGTCFAHDLGRLIFNAHYKRRMPRNV